MRRWLRRRSPGLSCDEVLAVLQQYLDGEVDATTAQQVAVHLDVCEGCGPEAEVYRNIKRSLQRRAEPVDPQVLADLERFGRRLLDGEVTG